MVTELLDARLAYKLIRKKNLAAAPAAASRLKTPDRSTAGSADDCDLKDLCGARQAFESYAAGLAAQHRTDAQLADLRRPLDAMQRILERSRGAPIESAALDELVREDIRFHLAIVEIARNAWLKKEIQRLRLVHRVSAAVFKARPLLNLDEHRRIQAGREAIISAIARGESSAAREAMERHLEYNPRRLRR